MQDILTIIKHKFDKSIINEDYLIWYILYCLEFNNDTSKIYTEKHHILPESNFKEYSNLNNNKWNSSTLEGRHHYIAHYLLMLAVKDKKHTYAFNMMKRILSKSSDDILLQSNLYESARELIRDHLSHINKGRKPSTYNINKLKESNRGKVVVKDKNGNTFRVSVDDERYKSGELESYRTGTKHKHSTIQKMKSNSGIRNKSPYYHSDGRIVYRSIEDTIEEGFSKVLPDRIRLNMSNAKIGTDYYYNPITKEQRKVKEDAGNILIDQGWVKGKIYYGVNDNPFKNKKSYRNFKTGDSGLCTKYDRYCGSPIAKFAFIVNDRFVSFSPSSFVNIDEDLSEEIVILCSNNGDKKIRKPTSSKRFFAKNNITIYSQANIKKIPINEFIDSDLYNDLIWVS